VAAILIVEGDLVVAQQLDTLLWRWGYQARMARDAGQALAAVSESRPAAIVVEVDLDGLDGLQLTRALKSEAATREIPVIALSAADRGQEAVAAGCAGFVRRPLDSYRLLALLRILAPIG